jgi:acetylornithine deacetylase/succinyl-diaminopimelate desuccinylase-like protein
MLEFSKNLKKRLHYEKHYLYPGGPTVNPGVKIEGGVYYGVIPGEAKFYFDLRVIPGMEYGQLIKDINDFLDDLKKADNDIDAELVLEDTITPWMPAAEIDKDNKLVQSCIDAAKDILGYEPRRVGVPFCTDASFIVSKLNIPTISSFGPGYIKLAHGPDEYVEVDSIIEAAKIYAITALDFLGG